MPAAFYFVNSLHKRTPKVKSLNFQLSGLCLNGGGLVYQLVIYITKGNYPYTKICNI